ILFGWAATLGLMLDMPYLNEMIFKTNTLLEVVIVYVFQIVPLSFILNFTAILQGYGKLRKPALFLMIGFVLKIILNVRLIVWLGVLGPAIANDIG
uniref:polysaccharide biosynthesis C-terminal domain-containing protein n=1 Tax=Lysinibacillus sp. D4A3_S15 TaxID=2941227 RepID=UPI0020BE891F